MAIRITCIKKDGGNHENPYVAINSFNWIEDGTNVTGTTIRDVMHDWVEKGGYGYVKDSVGNTSRLIAEISAKGTKFVKTKADSVTSDNLLKLDECK